MYVRTYVRMYKFELAKSGRFQPFWAKGFHRFKYGEVCSDLEAVAHKFANHTITTTSRVTVQ